ncbi:Ser-Thr-rich glycosyl-phosphatidyl-inositol-anchored membrane family [Kalmanozyma brasiliensis GHG001]|uniref:Yeast cell wall synthesis Kre9/Knh1-like N-terminal domain-containing protein n=1 Tax=Kalmanozyma brasiliensis (strain GHG001) TaxID=1365824 RepID=V5ENL8_KALBG|nr:Ser-Thr-rich glycosyl-phosphatidyl-inositol-anchored membrane family [Kalmanozyma brasiliensis GHG001]EST04518.1 Ser-Thr-rich glycosyl-phosphatidyl-inositol-anchored membrane family [Kalmanozyma brasiliensis GHG001]
MQLSSLVLAASLLISSVVSAPAFANFDVSSPASLMLRRQVESTNWDTMLGRDAPSLEKRIVYNPHITRPRAETVWTAGKTHTVKWDTSDMPPEAENYKGVIKLGYLPADGSGGENLHWTLADGFAIKDGKTKVTLPADLEERNDYIVVVMGDSGNASEKFTIRKAEAVSLGDTIQQQIQEGLSNAGL